MKRNRIGATDIDTTLPYWSDGKDTHQLRKSEIAIYALIDLLQEESNILNDDAAIQAKYNEMDMYFAVLKGIEAYAKDTDLLQSCGAVLGNMINDGLFSETHTSLEARNEWVNGLIAEMQERTTSFNESTFSDEFDKWFGEYVLDMNFYCDPTNQTTSARPLEKTAIGEVYGYDWYSAKAKESGHFWLYSVADRLESEPDEVIRKRLSHTKYINWFEGAQTGLSRASIMANAKAGIIAKTGADANTNLKSLLKDDGTPKVGIAWLILIPIIVACVTALSGLVVAVVSVVKAFKGDPPSEQELQGNAPSTSDWLNYGNSTGSGSSGDILADAVKSPIVWVGAALLAFALFS